MKQNLNINREDEVNANQLPQSDDFQNDKNDSNTLDFNSYVQDYVDEDQQNNQQNLNMNDSVDDYEVQQEQISEIEVVYTQNNQTEQDNMMVNNFIQNSPYNAQQQQFNEEFDDQNTFTQSTNHKQNNGEALNHLQLSTKKEKLNQQSPSPSKNTQQLMYENSRSGMKNLNQQANQPFSTLKQLNQDLQSKHLSHPQNLKKNQQNSNKKPGQSAVPSNKIQDNLIFIDELPVPTDFDEYDQNQIGLSQRNTQRETNREMIENGEESQISRQRNHGDGSAVIKQSKQCNWRQAFLYIYFILTTLISMITSITNYSYTLSQEFKNYSLFSFYIVFVLSRLIFVSLYVLYLIYLKCKRNNQNQINTNDRVNSISNEISSTYLAAISSKRYKNYLSYFMLFVHMMVGSYRIISSKLNLINMLYAFIFEMVSGVFLFLLQVINTPSLQFEFMEKSVQITLVMSILNILLTLLPFMLYLAIFMRMRDSNNGEGSGIDLAAEYPVRVNQRSIFKMFLIVGPYIAVLSVILVQLQYFKCFPGKGKYGGTCLDCIDTNCIYCESDYRTCNSCPRGFFIDTSIPPTLDSKQEPLNQCSTCPVSNCVLCQDYSGTCQVCQAGYRLESNQCIKCEMGGDGCSTCNKNQCLKCFDSYFMNENQQCQACNQSMKYCDKCDSSTTCLKCKQGVSILREGKCSCDILSGWTSISQQDQQCFCDGYVMTWQLNQCKRCNQLFPNCKQCQQQSSPSQNPPSIALGHSDLAETQLAYISCQQCNNGYYFDNNLKSCQSCEQKVQVSNCDQCNDQRCLQCVQGYFLGKDFNGNQACIRCLDSTKFCDSCRDDGICIVCKSGFVLNSMNQCEKVI
eukprot:403374175